MSEVPYVSPVLCLLPSLAASPFNIAPERRDELKELVTRHRLTIVFDDENADTTLKVVHGPDGNEIWFGVAFAERLWAYCFFYVKLLSKIGDVGPGGKIDFFEAPEFKTARELLVWAHRGQVQGETSAWPENLPKPAPRPTEDHDLFVATEAFLSIGGWILLHEVGHVVCGHSSRDPRRGDEHVQIEYEADDWASHWMLARWKEYGERPDPRVFVKRSLGATFALAIIASFEVYHRTYGGFKHPDPPERLLHFLDEFAPEGDGSPEDMTSDAWAAAVVIVKLHLDNAGKKLAEGEYESFRQFLVAAHVALG